MTDVNDPPSAVNVAGTASVPENSVAGTFAGQLQTIDEDYGQSHVYRIVAVSAGFDHRFPCPQTRVSSVFCLDLICSTLGQTW